MPKSLSQKNYITVLNRLKSALKGKVIIIGIGNTLRFDDGIGIVLTRRLKDRLPYSVWDITSTLENYLEKIIKEKPDTLIIIDAVDFGGLPGEIKLFDPLSLKTANLFSTHNISLSLAINYLQSNLKVDIIILAIQPKRVSFAKGLSSELKRSLRFLEDYFIDYAEKTKKG
ncbi:MAG: hydrogenase maturation protease [Candidatus Omnitrophica bacterium]|nr:hydrogenase maturation protease [Candidatus Omnitrophota bacterium]